ncbi:hypothetical protein IWW34DRAFT_745546 [Fusarium oxysporum f. sp. albedinis]|nr:hypothetical protein IWW34DRAFT_745546 [Fusarium oxysporum f. sp. albedinis]KAJ0137053.1 Oleate hydroxylase FAH12 [Fusarium oxysporum f. sp. albedinis]KAK2472798.1 hypothetical protein H9L39_14973 [Fusarium oxysporum f. sp. albedinis]
MEIKFKVQKAPAIPKPPPKNNTQPSTLAFVQVNPAKKDKAAQRKIRQHVMKDIGLSRRMGAVRTPDPTSQSIFIPTYWGDAQVCYNFRRLFRAMDMVSEGLLSIAIVDPVLRLRQKLTATFESPPTVEEIQQYTESLSLVREGIEAESKASENAVIGTVICLATFDMRAGNSESWMVHMAGLERIVEMAGGVEELDSRPAIRQSLFICDLLGSMVEDAEPRFPLPRDLPTLPKATQSRYVQKLLTSLRSDDQLIKEQIAVIDGALTSANQVAVLLNEVWRISPFALDILIPVCALAHQVLALQRMNSIQERHNSPSATSTGLFAEIIRVSAVSLFALVTTQASGDALYVAARRNTSVKHLMAQLDDKIWKGKEELKLWVLVIQVCMGVGSSKPWYLDQITQTMSHVRLQSWEGLMDYLRKVAWVEKVSPLEMTHLRSDIGEWLS